MQTFYEAALYEYMLLKLLSLLWTYLQRLWAEVEVKNKKLAQLTKERDNLSIEMEKQVKVSSILLLSG
jgi:hypothetical protein